MGTTLMGTSAVTVTINENSPGAVKALRSQIQAFSKGLDSEQALDLTGRALGTLQDEIYALLKKVIALAKAINSNAALTGLAPFAIQEVTAVHGTTTAIPATITPLIGNALVVFVSQDSMGGGLIFWNNLFRFAVTNIDTTASTVSVFQFVGRVDPADSIVRWFMIGLPLTGQV